MSLPPLEERRRQCDLEAFWLHIDYHRTFMWSLVQMARERVAAMERAKRQVRS